MVSARIRLPADPNREHVYDVEIDAPCGRNLASTRRRRKVEARCRQVRRRPRCTFGDVSGAPCARIVYRNLRNCTDVCFRATINVWSDALYDWNLCCRDDIRTVWCPREYFGDVSTSYDAEILYHRSDSRIISTSLRWNRLAVFLGRIRSNRRTANTEKHPYWWYNDDAWQWQYVLFLDFHLQQRDAGKITSIFSLNNAILKEMQG